MQPFDQDQNDRFIQQQKDNLKKIYVENDPTGTSKKHPKKPPVSTMVRQPKASHPKP